jgi:uncharacterized Tic20 family protein
MWAAMIHVSVVILIPILLLSFMRLLPVANKINGINTNCVYKPFPGCDDNNHRALLLLVNSVALLVLWGIPFIALSITMVILKIQKNLHPFIRDHATEAIKFQLNSSVYIAIIHLICIMFLWASSGFRIAHIGGLVIVTLALDLFCSPIFVGFQLIMGIFAATRALKGNITSYTRIRW